MKIPGSFYRTSARFVNNSLNDIKAKQCNTRRYKHTHTHIFSLSENCELTARFTFHFGRQMNDNFGGNNRRNKH